jgi:hypothetical protein
MIGHQHIGMDGAAEALGLFGQVVEVAAVVFLSVKAHRAVVATLDDVPGDAGDTQAGAAGHGKR